MKKPSPLLTAFSVLLPALAVAGSIQWLKPDAAPSRQAGGASAHYSLRSVKAGAPLHGQTASRSFRLKWSPTQRPSSADTATPDFRILSPGADTTVKLTPFPMLVQFDGEVRTHFEDLNAGWNTVILQATNFYGNTASDTARIFLDTATPPPCRPVIAAIPTRIAQLGQQFTALDVSASVTDCGYPASQLQYSVSGGTQVSGGVSGSLIKFTLNDASWYGTDSLKLVAQDPAGRRDSAMVRLQRRNTLIVNAIVRDFKENNTIDPTNNHPDFQPTGGSTCSGIGDMQPRIKVTGADPDDRNPAQLTGNTDCFRTRFQEWYTTSQDTLINRPFQVNLTFVDGGNGTIKYTNPNFFPIDNDSVFVPIGKSAKTFGHLQSAYPLHNFGFTMEFHAQFQYKRGTNQVFKFTGDDDVWVFLNDSLVIDLGGIHAALTDSVKLDNLPAGFLVDGQTYPLDFFSAERHTSLSNILITTSLSLSNAQSQISLDKKNYPAGASTGTVTLVDQSNGPQIETRTVEITSSNGDTLRTVATETAAFPGKFSRLFSMGAGPVNVGDTLLQITAPGTLSARYIDPDFGDTTTTISTYGPQNVVAITAPVDGQLVNHSPIAVAWNVNGLPQTTQLTAALAQGANRIIRSFTDESGTSADTVDLSMDSIPPRIGINAGAPDGSHGWYRNPVFIAFNCSDETRLAACSPPITVSAQGRDIAVSGQARDSAGNTSGVSLFLDRDGVPPLLSLVSSSQVPLRHSARVTLNLAASDSISGLANLECNGQTLPPGPNPRTFQAVLAEGPPQSVYCSATDTAGNAVNKTFVFTVVPNRAPVTVPDAYPVAYNTPLTVPPKGVLANDSDFEGDTLRAFLSRPPLHGTFDFRTDGSFSYAPADGYSGPDSLFYSATDGKDTSVSTRVSFSVAAAPLSISIIWPPEGYYAKDPSVAVHYLANGTERIRNYALADGDNFLIVDSADALGHHVADTVKVILDRVPPLISANAGTPDGANGWYHIHPSIQFTCSDDRLLSFCSPPAGISGEGRNIQVTGTARDSAGNTASATLILKRDATTPGLGFQSWQQAGKRNGALVTFFLSASDSISGIAGVSCRGEALSISQNPLQYQTFLATGLQTVACVAVDSAGNSFSNQVTLQVFPNQPPVAVKDSFSITALDTLRASAPGLLANDQDPEGDTLRALLVRTASHGTATLGTDGSLVYRPAAGFSGVDTLAYAATDGNDTSATALALVSVNATAFSLSIVWPPEGYLTRESGIDVHYRVNGSERVRTFPLAEGNNSLVVDSTDLYGRHAADTVLVRKDATAPVVRIVSPANGSIAIDSLATVRWTVDGVAQVSDTLAALVPGSNLISRSVTDSAGNTGSDTVRVTYQKCLTVQNQTIHLNQADAYGCVEVKNLGLLYAHKKLTANKVSVESGGKLYTDDTLQATTVTVENGGLVSHTELTETDAGKRVFISARTINLKAGSKIDVIGKGYPIGAGPGGSRNPSDFMAGSHAANGQSSPFPAYGSYLFPEQAGSGGGPFGNTTGHGGAGGGIARLAADTLILDGSILADGVANFYGSGAGGSVWLNALSLTGSGSISAKGALNTYYGSGGRIAIYANTVPFAIKQKLQAKGYGGGSLYLDERLAARELKVDTGFGGTTRAFALADSTLSLKLSQGSKSLYTGDTRVKDIVWNGPADAAFSGQLRARKFAQAGGTAEVADTCRIDTLLLESSSILTHKAGAKDTVWKAYIVTDTLHVAAGAKIDVSGRGYANGRGPNGYASTQQYRGGSHASRGNAAVLAAYDDPYMPALAGAGGSDSSSGSGQLANGGGKVRVIAGKIGLDGSILANGVSIFYGTGAGGSIWLTTSGLTGSGMLSANGSYGNYFGGGGRIAVYADTLPALLRQKAVAKGDGGGTIYLQDLHGYKEFRVDTGFGGSTPVATTLNDATLLLRLNQGSKSVFTGNTLVKNAAWSGPADAVFPGKVRMNRLFQLGGTSEIADTCRIDTILLESTSILTHKAGVKDTVWKAYIVADTLHVATGAKIDVSGRGYANGRGPNGYASTQQYRGGSHASRGNAAVLAAYDDPYMPALAGAGGSDSSSGSGQLANGGGIVRVIAGKIGLDGSILANGVSIFYGTGAGGSIWLTTSGLTGSGMLSANGSYGNYFGGGGRIAVYADTLPALLRQKAVAKGDGGGTIYLQDLHGYKEFRVDTGFGGMTPITTTLNNASLLLRLKQGSKSVFTGNTLVKNAEWGGPADAAFPGKLQMGHLLQMGGTVEVSDTCRIDTVLLESTSILTHKAAVKDTVWKAYIVADTLHVATGAKIDVSGRDYVNGRGPNGYASTQQFRGGSHGGIGYGSDLPPFDDAFMPVLAGSGGSDSSSGSGQLANGGGIVRVIADKIGFDGSILANGLSIFYGTGAGGSVWLSADAITGSGGISAHGAFGNYPGGGGRIALTSCLISQAIRDQAKAAGFAAGTVRIPCFDKPVVQILSPAENEILYRDTVPVTWQAEGVPVHRDTVEILHEGTNNIVRCFTNGYGNTGCDTTTVRVDLHPPIVKILDPLNHSYTTHSVDTVLWSVDGVAQPVSTENLAEGSNRIIRAYTAPSGSRGADTVFVTMDTKPPVIDPIAPAQSGIAIESSFSIRWNSDGIAQPPVPYTMDTSIVNSVLLRAVDSAGNSDSLQLFFYPGTRVPDLIGKSASAAESLLTTTGLGAESTWVDNNDLPSGTVSAQAPHAGDSIRFNFPVKYQIARGLDAKDLVPASVTADSMGVDPVTLAASGSIRVVTANQGRSAVTDSFDILVFEDRNRDAKYTLGTDLALGRMEIRGGIPAGDSATVMIPVAGGLTFNGNRISVMVDYAGRIAETHEDNNYSQSMAHCKKRPVHIDFTPKQVWSWTDTRGVGTGGTFSIPITANFTDDNGDGVIDEKDIPDVVVQTHDNTVCGGMIRLLDGKDGHKIWEAQADPYGFSDPAVGDIDGDGKPEIVYLQASQYCWNRRVMVLDYLGNVKRTGEFYNFGSIGFLYDALILSDLDADGKSEIIWGPNVFDYKARLVYPKVFVSDLRRFVPADVDGDGYQELIGSSRPPNSLEVKLSIIDFKRKKTVYGDLSYQSYPVLARMGTDPIPQIVGPVQSMNRTGGFETYNLSLHKSGTFSGTPFQDPPYDRVNENPEKYFFYGKDSSRYFYRIGSTTLCLPGKNSCLSNWYFTRTNLWDTTTVHKVIHDTIGYGRVGTVFDLDGNGTPEIIYQTSDSLFVLDSSGAVLSSIHVPPHSNGDKITVSDLDRDGHADIITGQGNPGHSSSGWGSVNQPGIIVYSNPTWVGARSIFNQEYYTVNNIEDNARIPRIPAPYWKGDNTVNIQCTEGDYACVDVSASFPQMTFNGSGERGFAARIGNGGALELPAGVPVSLFATHLGIESKLTTKYTPARLQPGEYYPFSFALPASMRGSYTFRVAADDSGNGHGQLDESSESNNSVAVTFMVNNESPVITQPAVQYAEPNEAFSFAVQASDPDGDALSYSLAKAPAGMSINAATGVISWTPAMSAARCTVTVAVSDPNQGSASESFLAYVGNRNNPPPVFTSTPSATAHLNTLTSEHQAIYRYDAIATDPDGGIEYAFTCLDCSGRGGSLPGFSQNRLDWLPFQPFFTNGEIVRFVVTATDLRGGVATQAFSVRLDRGGNQRPVFINPPNTNAIEDQPWHSSAEVLDIDGDPVTLFLDTIPVGMTYANDSLHWTPAAATANGLVRIHATDGIDTVVQRFTVSISPRNDAPRISSIPPASGTAGAVYAYQVAASDEEGDPLDFSLEQKPSGMTVSSQGLIQWTAPQTPGTTANARVLVKDNHGGETRQSWQITLVQDTLPPGVSVAFSQNPVRPGRADTVAVLASDNVAIASLALRLNGNAVALTGGKYVFTPPDTGSYAFSATAVDPAGNTGTAAGLLRASRTAAGIPPQVTLTHTPASPHAGDLITFQVTASDSDGIDSSRLWVDVDGASIEVAGGMAAYRALRPGNLTAQVAAYDNQGNSALATDAFFVAPQGGDAVPPTADIASPEEDSVILGQALMRGTAFDANLAYYTLSYRAGDAGEWIEFLRSESNVQDGVLGPIDGTNLIDGPYKIRLDVYDRSGNTNSRSVDISIGGEKKVGAFTLAFQDLTLPMSGLELSVTRSYDSRVKTRGDFGYGWQMGMRSVRLSENRNQGTAWSIERSPGLIPQYSIAGTKTHTVTVTLPGGRTQQFDAVPRFFNRFDPSYGVMEYKPQPGTYSALTAIAVDTFLVQGGELYDQNGDFQGTFDPEVYKLTLLDGSYFIVDQGAGGIIESGDANGNKLVWESNAIRHSAGKSIDIARDGQGRITAISDAAGRGMQYRYDVLGNLGEVIDANGNSTRLKYGRDHYLTEIIDARGIRAARTEYDGEGRMIRQINADGDTLSLTHDLAANSEAIEDFNGHETVYTYDSAGNVLTKTDAAHHTWAYAYDSLGNTISTTPPGGHATHATFDAKGNELTHTDELGYTTVKQYDLSGHVKSSRDALQRLTRYEYDGNGNLLREIGPDGAVASSHTYDGRGNALTETDALGHTIHHTYNSLGWLLSTTDALGHTRSFGHDAAGNVAYEVNAIGDTTRYANDANGNRLYSVGPQGDTARTAYNAINKPISRTDALGNITRFEYGNLGDKLKDIAPDGSYTERTYDAQGNAASIRDAAGRITRMEYDSENRLVRTLNPDNSYTRTVYDALGRRTQSFDALGNATSFGYDDAGRNILVTDVLGHETHFEYDAAGRKTAMVDALGQRTVYAYDDYDRLVSTTFPNASATHTAYDAAGRKTSETDANGHSTGFEYDDAGNLTAVVDALGHRTAYTYDAAGNRLTQLDANGHNTRMEYDASGRMSRKIYPNSQEERWTYDANGNALSHVKGQDSAAFEYDARGQETKRTHIPSGHQVFTSYTPDGKRDSVQDYRGYTLFAYDNRGRLAREEMPNGDFLQSQYDANGNRISSTTPFGETRYHYDALNRMDTVYSPQNQATAYHYNAVGNRDSVRNANGTTVGYSYDALNRLTALRNRNAAGTLLGGYTYGLDAAGIRRSVTEAGGSQVQYGYDNLYRLLSETRTGSHAYANTFTYDDVGNRLTQAKGGITTTYAYNSRDQLLSETSSAGTVAYAYDAAGRMGSKTDAAGTTTYTWVDEDRMASVSGPGVSVQYSYDADGRRVKETSGATVKQYLIDRQLPYGQVVAETDGSAGLNAQYVYGLERISQLRTGGARWYLADGQGSVRALTDASGSVTDTYDYTAFGEALASTGSTVNEFRYVGEQLDPNLGFYYNRARWYDGRVGRFTAVDPLDGDSMAPVSLHRYLYANASPVSSSDPSGKITLLETMNTLAVSSILIQIGQVVGSRGLGHSAQKDIEWNGIITTGSVGLEGGAGLLEPELGGVFLTGWSEPVDGKRLQVSYAGVVFGYSFSKTVGPVGASIGSFSVKTPRWLGLHGWTLSGAISWAGGSAFVTGGSIMAMGFGLGDFKISAKEMFEGNAELSNSIGASAMTGACVLVSERPYP